MTRHASTTTSEHDIRNPIIDKKDISAPRIELGTFRLQSNITVERDKPTTPSGGMRRLSRAWDPDGLMGKVRKRQNILQDLQN
jgi:hypothetical protein